MSAPVKFLLVDDLPDNLLALEALLQQPGLFLIKARGGAEALEMMLANDFALAIIDVQMPDMDGFELAELMRGAKRTQNIPIIFVTAGMRDQQRVFQGYDTGAVDFLFKPIDPFILRHKTRTFFELYRQRQQLNEQVEQLRKAEELKKRILENSRDEISTFDTRGVLLSCNRKIDAKSWDELWHEGDLSSAKKAFSEALEGKNAEFHGKRANGETYDAIVAPLKDGKALIDSVLLISRRL